MKETVESYSAYLTHEKLENCSAFPAFHIMDVGFIILFLCSANTSA